MKFNVPTRTLAKALQVNALPNNELIPITSCFKAELKGNSLSLTSTDLENTLKISLEVEGIEDGITCISGKKMVECVKALTCENLSIKTDDKIVTIKSDKGVYKFPCYLHDEFPLLPEGKAIDTINIAAKDYEDIINKTSYCTSTDDLRVSFQGVYHDSNEKSIVSTDGHRMAVLKAPFEINNSYIVGSKSLNKLMPLLKRSTALIIEFTEKNATYKLEGCELTVRLVDAKYPNYSGIIPTDFVSTVSTDRIELINALTRVGLFTNTISNAIKLQCSSNGIEVIANDADFDRSANESLNCEFEGESMDISFNSRFMIQALSKMNEDQIQLKLKGINKAAIVKPLNSDSYFKLLMPVVSN